MRITINVFSKKALLFCLLLLSLSGSAQNLVLTLTNQSSTSNTFDFDLMLTVPAGGKRIYSVSCGVNFNAAILNGGTPSITTSTVGGESFSLVPGSRAPEFSGSAIPAPTTSYRGPGTPQLRVVTASTANVFVDLPAGTYRYGKFRFTNTVNWTASSNANLWISPTALIPNAGGTNAQVGQSTTASTNPTTNTTTSNPALLLSHTSTSTFSVPLNSCPSSVAASNLVAESPCAGAANGSATITLTGGASGTATVSYSVDGGSAQNATMSAFAFTVSGLTAGSHTVAVTYPGCSAVSTSAFTIGAGAPLTTNGSVTTSICAGQSFTWPANGLSYTTAQSNLQFVSGCNTATLNLSITPLTTTGSVTTSICAGQTYVWPANGQSYTTAQSGLTVVTGCNTATLNLSITPLTTTGSESVSACGTSYTWPLNGQTYNASGTYTEVVGCNTATLTLTLTPFTTTGSESVSACGTSYVWPLNGSTYTSSGTYTHVVGCNTATLTLTLTPATTTGSESVSACGSSYTWALNGQTYNASGTYTHVVGCNTATLTLTLTPNTTTGSESVSACGTSYTWAVNGQTYNASGVYPYVVGCNTATLTLTLTPNTTTGSESVSACGTSYTWAVNGQTYNASGVYPYVVGCNTATLTLTLTPNTTTGSESVSACGSSYTWAVNGQTYNASGVYPYVVGCNTATLTLTLTPNTTTGSESVSACGTSYTWALNGSTYNASGTYTHVVGCNTATLTLTLSPFTTTGSESVTACGTSYTWSVSGQTYNASGVYPFVSGCNTATLTLTLNTSAITYYADTDGDGFGFGTGTPSCTGQPAGTSANNTDCAPSDPLKWRTGNFFVDADNDGYNNGFPAAPVCYGALTPSGYVAVNNGTDCNDNVATINSNASEVLANGVDDNCDGTTDEVTPLSSLITTSCGVTLTNLSNTLFAYPLSNFQTQTGPIQGYRFRVTNGATVRTLDSSTNSFALTSLVGGATYATTYTIEVSVKHGGYYRAYGPSCSVSTPAVPNTTNISNPSCGSTLTDINNTIFCTQVPSASGYRFRVRNGATLLGTVDTAVNRFSLTSIAGYQFGTTYTIDVLLAFNNVYRPDTEYGPACSITTPATPGTSRVIQPTCGSTINAFWTTIFAQQVSGAQGYKFVVTNGVQTRQYTTANPRFALQNLPGGAAANTAYTIRVDVLYNASYVQGTVLCTITTSPTASRQASAALDIYEVKAYPNPYADTFKLDVNTSSEDQVGVRVYDMLGREVESRQSSVDAITNLEIGSRYPSGVYNIIVTQGDHVKTLRVIKR
ncbi:T9SS type A sorting domain-containing protein [Flavobacterium sp.]|uniref:T9SS type A sorting domain-containing protein n=1 Tax=Flavobacterium sp. TaxID=239 RepID=UPI00286A1446|nr:T9SS type A sorting domain-containing protein [Flavobacterium sp.]